MAKGKRWFAVRPSSIQGRGAFAVRSIPSGTRVSEYCGERITLDEAMERYDEEAMERTHTFLFAVDSHIVIDAERHGNAARFINHSCEPNCQALIEDKRIYIETLCDIPDGTELTYDYRLSRNGRYGAKWERRYLCHCGAPTCRGTLLAPIRHRKKTSQVT